MNLEHNQYIEGSYQFGRNCLKVLPTKFKEAQKFYVGSIKGKIYEYKSKKGTIRGQMIGKPLPYSII